MPNAAIATPPAVPSAAARPLTLGPALPPSACPPRARERLVALGLWPAGDPRHPGRDATAAVQLLEAFRAQGRPVSLAGAPGGQPGLEPRYAWCCTLGGPPAKRPGWGPDPARALWAAVLEELGGCRSP